MMKVLALVLCLAVAAFAVDQSTVNSFIAFQHQYGKFYTTPQEFNHRLAVFAQNLQTAADLQKGTNITEYGVTKFMDMTPQEFKDTILMKKVDLNVPGTYVKQNYTTTAPSSFDWRSRAGVVTPVYNQGQCGSCWAFSATENIESQWALRGHGLHSLSMQQIVSCDRTSGGCNGGSPQSAYQYVIGAGGIEAYGKYPYTAKTGSCSFNAGGIEARIGSWSYVTQSKNEGEMVNYLVANGPLSICVDANNAWQFYKGGILTPAQCGLAIDHAVEAIGYNTAANPPYWIVRNSWGGDWGMGGYIHLQYGHNTCALAQVVTMSHAR